MEHSQPRLCTSLNTTKCPPCRAGSPLPAPGSLRAAPAGTGPGPRGGGAGAGRGNGAAGPGAAVLHGDRQAGVGPHGPEPCTPAACTPAPCSPSLRLNPDLLFCPRPLPPAAIKCLYWARLAYRDDPLLDHPHLNIAYAMELFGLDQWEVLVDPESDTHAVLGWSVARQAAVVAFR